MLYVFSEDPVAPGDQRGDSKSAGPAAPDVVVDSPPIDLNKVAIPVLVIACNRPTVKRNIDQLLK